MAEPGCRWELAELGGARLRGADRAGARQAPERSGASGLAAVV